VLFDRLQQRAEPLKKDLKSSEATDDTPQK